MGDLGAFCCSTPVCADLGKRGHGNLSVTARYGPGKARRMLRRRTCEARFSERKGTPYFRARLLPEEVADVLAHYEQAIRDAYGRRVTPPRTGRPYPAVSPGVAYATVHKGREGNRVVRVGTRVAFGAAGAVTSALALSPASRSVNTRFVERHDGTDRNRRSRKARKSCAFPKDWAVHRAAAAFSYFSYNFCWPVRTRRVKGEGGRWRQRTPAMAAGLPDRVWSLNQWLTYTTVQRK